MLVMTFVLLKTEIQKGGVMCVFLKCTVEVKPVLPSSASLKCPSANVCVLLFCLFCSPNLCLTLGEGAINLALAQSRSQDVRINGPLGASNAMRMDTGFPMQGGQGKSPQGFFLQLHTLRNLLLD